MRLKDLIGPLGAVRVIGGTEAEVTGICLDSRAVAGGPGGGPLFAAIPGEHVDGHEFIGKAVELGASAVLASRPVEGLQVPQVIVEDTRAALSKLSDVFYASPSKEICVLGVTGTNGKTTVAYLVESILREAGYSPGVVGTVNYRYGGNSYPAAHTTPQAPDLHRMLREMADSGVTHCVMEVSSHALEQKRVADVAFRAGVFTNLTHDHLDYHATMEEYFGCKSMLFGLVDGNRGVLVTNMDDAWGRLLKRDFPASVTCSLEEGADVYPRTATLGDGITSARIRTPAGDMDVTSHLAGEYNLQNVLASVAAGFALGICAEAIKKGVSALESVPGRLQKVVSSDGFTAYVDYAHTGDALERALSALRNIASGRIISVFGCGGNRDRLKRPEMGGISARLADISIVTSDNPRDEDPLEIIEEIEAGIKGIRKYSEDETPGGRGYIVVPDRAAAISRAVGLARRGDVILLAGKGHEDYQIVGGQRLHFSDMEAVSRAIGEREASEAGGAALPQ
ncbi:MAG: UDP-N-acetylmuramoyl-L-alanyl-D-glutamate--2,6-diaminopimelate ligase [Thermodesulfobacteriota bacterium]